MAISLLYVCATENINSTIVLATGETIYGCNSGYWEPIDNDTLQAFIGGAMPSINPFLFLDYEIANYLIGGAVSVLAVAYLFKLAINHLSQSSKYD